MQKLKRRPVLFSLLALAMLSYGLYRAVGSVLPPTFAGTVIEEPQRVDGVELVQAGGASVTFPDAWRGKIVLAFFGYTQCPDVCPLTMAELTAIYRDLGEPADLQVVMVTVDPARDTPERVDRFAKGFHADFVGLGGDPGEIAKAAARFYASSVAQNDGEVAHSSHVTLLDADGRMRLIYTQDNVPKMTADLAYILARDRW